MKTVKVRNLYGYPAVTKTAKDFAKEANAILLLDQVSLLRLSKEQRLSKRPKLLIENPAVLTRERIPILGYREQRGFFYRGEMPHPSQLVENKLTVKVPKYKRLPTAQFVEALKAPRKDKFLKQFDKDSEEARMVRAMFNRFLPPSLKDPFTEPEQMKSRHATVRARREAEQQQESKSEE